MEIPISGPNGHLKVSGTESMQMSQRQAERDIGVKPCGGGRGGPLRARCFALRACVKTKIRPEISWQARRIRACGAAR